MQNASLPVAVIGAGPVGLAAAAHLIERGETPIVFEAGADIGANVRAWAHVRMFSPWEYTVDSASVRLLQAHGWNMPPKDELPTGADLIDRYMRPFAALPEVQPHLHLNARVIAVSRRHADKMKDTGREDAPFVLHVVYAHGDEALIEARAVIDATGTWQQPNPMGANGLPAVGEKRHHDHIAYGIPDILGEGRARYSDQRVLVVGSGHSAINALLALVELATYAPKTRILWAMRRGDQAADLRRVYGGGGDDALPARGALGTRIQAAVASGVVERVAPFRIREIASAADGLAVTGETNDGLHTVHADQIIVAAGARPELAMLRELRLDLDPSLESTRQLAPLIDPNIHSCGTVRPHGEAELRQPEKDFYIVGMKSYGRAPTFLLATGYEQVRSVVAALAGDWAAASDVQLWLPETGVCSTDGVDGESCCAPAVPSPAVVSFESIPVNGFALQPIRLMPLQVTGAADSGQCCDENCCS
ncbi:MAG: NAD(P)-binding domain-containing protein [bacterium]|nr:NAD(P)-binding domain-containing protein [bacterium]